MVHEFRNLFYCLTLFAIHQLGLLPEPKWGFYCMDPEKSHPFGSQSITALHIIAACIIPPFLFFVFIEIIRTKSLRKIDSTPVVWYKHYLLVLSILFMVMEFIKILVARQRPNFFDICRPDAAINCTAGEYVETWNCTSKKFRRFYLLESSRSFPSGHTMVAVYMAIAFASYISDRLSDSTHKFLKVVSILACFGLAVFCGLTRIWDKMHFPSDVVAGGFLGCALGKYFLYLVHIETQERNKHLKAK